MLSTIVLLSQPAAQAAEPNEGKSVVTSPQKVQTWYWDGLAPGATCPQFSVCLWDQTWYTGLHGMRFYGTISPCEGVRWEQHPYFQDNIRSFQNLSSGTISFWDRYSDGTYRYSRIGNYGAGFKSPDFGALGRRADAFVYDPNGNCSRLYLRWIMNTKVTTGPVEVVDVAPVGAASIE